MAISSSNFHQSGVRDRRINSGTLTFNFDGATQELTAELRNVNIKVNTAVNRAVKKTAQWLRTHSIRELGKELGIKQAPLKSRFVVGTNPKQPGEAKVWIGLLAIGAHLTGNVSQNQAGAKAAKRQYDGAFYKSVHGSDEKVYIRASRNRVMQHDVVRENRRRKYRSLQDPKLKGRFPLHVVGVNIEEPADRIIQRFEARINQRYRELLTHELKYVLSIE